MGLKDWGKKVTGIETAQDVARTVKKDPNPWRAIGPTTGQIARGTGNILTFGAQDKISVGGKPLGEHIEKGVGDAWSTLSKGLSSMDPTKVGRADESGVRNIQGDLQAREAAMGKASTQAAGRAAPQVNPNAFAINRRGVANVQGGTVQAGPGAGSISGTIDTVADRLAGREGAVGAGAIENADTLAARALQAEALGMQRDAALGNAPSAAQLQLQAGLEDSIDAQMAAAASARGGFNPAAMRNAQRVGAQLSQQANQQSAILRADEMAKARDAFAGTAGTLRGQDVGQSQAQAELALRADTANLDAGVTQRAQELQAMGMDQQTALATAQADQATRLGERQQNLQAEMATRENELKAALANQGVDLEVLKANAAMGNQRDLANLEAKLKQAGMNDEMVRAYMTNVLESSKARLGAETELVKNETNRQLGISGNKMEALKGGMGMVGELGSAVGGIASMFSDPKLKTDVSDADAETEAFLRALKPKAFRYKNSAHGKGRRLGIMTTDAKKSPLGATLVIAKPEGEAIDVNAALSAALAGLALVNRKIDRMEKKGA